MKLYKEPFYTSHQVLYKGCFFHSMLELKFVLSIEDNFRFLREPVHICYYPKTLKTVRKSDQLTRIYTPDFLIRHKEYGWVWLIEIKPDFLKGSPEVNYCEQIMKNFIAKNRLDWGTAIIYSNDIVLSEAKQKKFEIMRACKDKYEEAIALKNFIRRYSFFGKSYYRTVPVHRADLITNRQYENFVRYGLLTKKRYGKT
ncbi:MAG TPA: hypothetical protein VII28_12335 [Puia sp.]